MCAGAAGDRVDDHAVGGGTTGAGQQGGRVLEFVETVDTDHPELPHRRVHHLVGAGQFAGVGGGGPCPGLGAADLDRDDGHPAPGRPVGGEQKGPSVLEPLDVTGDGPDLGALGEVGDEVRGLQVRLVAGGRPVGEPYAQLLEGEHGPPLVSRLRDQGDRGARQVVAEPLEGIQVGVGSEQSQPGPFHGRRQPRLRHRTGVAGLRVPGGEGDGELHLGLGQFPDHRQRIADEQHREVDLLGQVGDGGGAAQSEDVFPGRMHGIEPCADPLGPVDELPGDAGVGPSLAVGRADDGDGRRPEEPVEIRHGCVQRPSADVHGAVGRGDRGGVMDGLAGLFAAGHHSCAEVGGEGAVS